MKRLFNYFFFLFFFIGFINCSEVEVILPDDSDSILVNLNFNPLQLETFNGEAGLIIDTREIYHKGYYPELATFTFPEHERFDTVIEIDPILNFAVFKIDNDSLSDEEKLAFGNGIMTKIEISDNNQILSEFEDVLVIDSSNNSLSLETNLEFIPRDVTIKRGLSHLLIFKTKHGTADTPSTGVLTMEEYPTNGLMPFQITPYAPGEGRLQNLYLDHVEGSRYKIKFPAMCVDFAGNWEECPDGNPLNFTETYPGGWITMQEDTPDVWYPYRADLENSSEASIFEIVHKENGWYEMFYVDNNSTLHPWKWWSNGTFRFGNGSPGDSTAEIRLVSDYIDYNLEYVSTSYLQPLIPPVQLDFAFQSEITNCSPATITEVIGINQTRSRTVASSTTESFQLFAQIEAGVSTTLGFEAGFRAGGVEITGGAGFDFRISGSVTAFLTATTSITTSTQNTISTSFSEEIEVSRSRSITVPPFIGVNVFDYVKKSDNIRIPFTTKISVSGINNFNGETLSGAELFTQMKANLFGGLITEVGEDFVILSIRGYSEVNSFFVSSSGASQIEDACE